MGLRDWRWWPWRRARRAVLEGGGTATGTTAPAGPMPERSAAGLTLGEATELLDELERQGIQVLSVDVGPDARVSVQWVKETRDPSAGDAR
ncbi:MAG TPA: hypothetical protein VKD90_17975 [Gemmataceae bacterium]|nr:hypothetical protein [Gemmataceae bacterium]